MACETSFFKAQRFTKSRLLFCSFSIRLCLVLYSHIHDYLFKVNFTDVDYYVFSDASVHVYNGGSPFDRETYRYTPALAWMLLPIVKFPDFGKILFCIFDIIVAELFYKIVAAERTKLNLKTTDDSSQNFYVLVFWLANPMTAIISTRGNAESVVATFVLLTLYLLEIGYWKTSALVHGLLAINFKIYPIIFLPSIFVNLSSFRRGDGFYTNLKALLFNRKGYLYAMISLLSFGVVVVFFYYLYGNQFLEEYIIYHIKRRDIRHNFSPYFFILYIFNENIVVSKILGFMAFIPQIIIIVVFSFKYFDDLSFCWFLTTWGFVSFNKVCTSQYFIWYIVFLPLVARNINLKFSEVAIMSTCWFASQGLWLYPAYLFEFHGVDTFIYMFGASILFLLCNSYLVYIVRKKYINCKLKSD